jgi:hypothetical protein
MHTLTEVSHEHHDVLWRIVEQLGELAECLDSDCLDTSELVAGLPRLRDVLEGLTGQLVPHMEAVETAVHPTLERILAEHGTTAPMAAEHAEIRRLVGLLQDFVEHPPQHPDRPTMLRLRRILLRLEALLRTHLVEEELYLPILEDRLTPSQEAALARALDHLAAERL